MPTASGVTVVVDVVVVVDAMVVVVVVVVVVVAVVVVAVAVVVVVVVVVVVGVVVVVVTVTVVDVMVVFLEHAVSDVPAHLPLWYVPEPQVAQPWHAPLTYLLLPARNCVAPHVGVSQQFFFGAVHSTNTMPSPIVDMIGRQPKVQMLACCIVCLAATFYSHVNRRSAGE